MSKAFYYNNLMIIPSRGIIAKYFLKENKENYNIIDYNKNIYIYENDILIYSGLHTEYICIDFEGNMIYFGNLPENINEKMYNSGIFQHKLWCIQNQLKLYTGFFHEEYHEQLFVTKYLTGNENVLELGGNIGRNSVVISYILNKCNNNNLVTLETSKKDCDILALHRNLNNLNFHIENAALSKRKLIQRGWNTIPSDIILDGWESVNTITFVELCEKYQIQFDTLIIDCEGAFFQILLDMPYMLTNIKTIIIENDYTELWQKQCVDHILHLNCFKNVDKMPLGLSIDWVVCPNNFYEVWRKDQ